MPTDPRVIKRWLLNSKRYLVGANLSSITQGAQQLTSHLNKAANVGYDNWLDAYVESQKAENIKMMYD